MAKTENSKRIDAYISATAKKVESYKQDVESGAIVTNKYIKLAIARSRTDAERTDIRYDANAVRRVFKFFYFLRIKTGSKYRRFNLTPYQAWILSEIFGWYYTTSGKRRYRYALLYTARKSGKTVFVVGIEFYMLMYDREEDPEAYLCATTREQAGQALRYSKNIVKKSPSLLSRLKVQQFQILYEKRSGIMKVLANKPDSNDSLNPYVFIIDEMHAHPTLAFYNVMKSGIMSRRNPLGLITSTAGFNKDYPFFTMLETAKKVLEGSLSDDITFYALYTLDEGDDVEDYSTWIKANPNISVTVDFEALIAEYKKAALSISERNNFLTKNLNQYLDNLDQWIPDDQYVRNFRDVVPPPPGQRLPAYAGIDLSSNRDLASFVIVYETPDGAINVIPEFYFPQNETKRIRDSGIDLSVWIEKGYIIEHPTPTIDQELIYERVAYYNSIFEIRRINFDKWNAGYLIPKIETSLYIECKHFQQVTTWFNFPLKYIEKLMFEEKLNMSRNPAMRWQFRNIVLYYDGNGNIKVMKNKSKDSVDGPVSFGMAIAGYLEYSDDITAAFFKEIMQTNTPE